MSESPFITEERGEKIETKLCPILKAKCQGEKCQFWVVDYREELKTYRADCAVTMIAKGLTDEMLLKLKG